MACKRAILPKFEVGVPVRLWTFDFAKWWFICRLMEVNNFIFLRHVRGTVLLNWFYGAMVRLVSKCRLAYDCQVTSYLLPDGGQAP